MHKAPSQINKSQGFSLVELLIAMAIFSMFVLSTTTVIQNVSSNARGIETRERAATLIEESFEAARNFRDASSSFAYLPDGTFGITQTGGTWSFSGTSDTQDVFTRTVTVATSAPYQKKITTTVNWDDGARAQNLTASTLLTDWRLITNLGVGLTVSKTVINHGGSKIAADFAPFRATLGASSTTLTLGEASLLLPGRYTISETVDSNYTQSFSGDCNASGQVVLTTGSSKSCNITNEEKPSQLIVNKTVINNGGSKTADDFVLTVDSNPVTRGVATTFNSGVHTVSEVPDPDYTATFGGDCDVSGLVTLIPNTTKTCTITNEENLLAPTVTTPTVASIGMTVATLGANVTSLGRPASITARGTCWGTNPSPITNCVAEGGTTSGVFTQSRTGFVPGTTYYYRGYATNGTGTAYSEDGTFTTLAICSTTLVGTPNSFDSAGATAALVNKPTGVVSGDIMFAHVLHSNATDSLNSIPTGWNPVGTTGSHKNGSNNQALYYKVAGASEGASYSFGLSTSSRFAVTISAYRGCFDTANPIDASSNVEYVVNDTTYRAASMNLPSQYTNVLMFPSMFTGTVRTFANPLTQGGGWTEDYDFGTNTADFSRAGYRKLINASGVTGVIDSIGRSGSTVKHTFGVALKPLP